MENKKNGNAMEVVKITMHQADGTTVEFENFMCFGFNHDTNMVRTAIRQISGQDLMFAKDKIDKDFEMLTKKLGGPQLFELLKSMMGGLE